MSASLLARAVHGLEWVCADEVAEGFPAARDITMARRELTFSLPRLDPELLRLRTPDDLFLSVGALGGVGTAKDVPPALARRMARLPFADRVADLHGVRDLPARPRFDVVASLEGRRNFNRFDVENASGAVLAPLLGATYLERTSEGRQEGEPDLTVRLFVRGPEVVAALRLGRRPLHRRAYKLDTGPGTLHPPLAAALARLVATPRPGVVVDPFCGDGTLAIESALSLPDTLVAGGDIDPARLANARANAGRAGVTPSFVLADAAEAPWRPGTVDAVVTNPPWNLAVDAGGRLGGSLDALWRAVPHLLAAGGRLGVVTDAGLDAPGRLARLGYAITLGTQIRLAGRVSHLVLAAPPGGTAPALSGGQAAWRARAIEGGVVTVDGF